MHEDAQALAEAPVTEWVQPIERMVVKIIVAMEVGSAVMVTAMLIAFNAPGWSVVLTLALIVAGPYLLSKCRLRVWLCADRLRYRFAPFWFGSLRYEQVGGVEAIRVDAMNDFMGWGPQTGKLGLGMIAQSGPAVRIERLHKKRDLILTTDDAEGMAAALLERILASAPIEEMIEGVPDERAGTDL